MGNGACRSESDATFSVAAATITASVSVGHFLLGGDALSRPAASEAEC